MTCSKCHGPNDRTPQRYCRACHAAYQRAWRPRRTVLLRTLQESNTQLLDRLRREQRVPRETIEARR